MHKHVVSDAHPRTFGEERHEQVTQTAVVESAGMDACTAKECVVGRRALSHTQCKDALGRGYGNASHDAQARAQSNHTALVLSCVGMSLLKSASCMKACWVTGLVCHTMHYMTKFAGANNSHLVDQKLTSAMHMHMRRQMPSPRLLWE